MGGARKDQRVLVVYEKTPTGYSAYVPDSPSCISNRSYVAGYEEDHAGSDRRALERHARIRAIAISPADPQPPRPMKIRR